MAHSKKVKAFFDNTDNYLKNNSNISLRKRIIKTLIGDKKGNRILDVGCGDGELSKDYIFNNNVDFLDISNNMLDIIKKKIKKKRIDNIKFIQGDFLNYHFDKKYDLILFIGVLAHVDSVKISIKKVSDLLNKNGIAIFQFTNTSNLIGMFIYLYYNNFYSFFSKNKNYRLNKIKLNDLNSEFEKNGLTLKKKISHASLLPGMGLFSKKFRNSFQNFTIKNHISFYGSEVFLRVEKI